MQDAEREARVLGCDHAHLTTLDFQAKGFYEKLGYEVFAALEDYPRGSPIASFSAADLDGVMSWRMANAAHMAWADAAQGSHQIVVQNRGNRGAWSIVGTTECLSGWNATGNFLSVEEIP